MVLIYNNVEKRGKCYVYRIASNQLDWLIRNCRTGDTKAKYIIIMRISYLFKHNYLKYFKNVLICIDNKKPKLYFNNHSSNISNWMESANWNKQKVPFSCNPLWHLCATTKRERQSTIVKGLIRVELETLLTALSDYRSSVVKRAENTRELISFYNTELSASILVKICEGSNPMKARESQWKRTRDDD